MGFFDAIGDMFGGASNNAGYTAQQAPILQHATVDQANNAYTGAQHALDQQQLLIQALQGQNGLNNQSQVFNQLQGVANGTGPNPAQAMLDQATGANVSNQAALMAGQRGASANPALIASLIARQGAATQQQAAGQGATLQAQQQLNALGQLGGIANSQVSNQIGATGNYNQLAQGEQSQLLNAINAINQANVSATGNQNNANQNMAGINANNTNKNIGGLFGGLTGPLTSFGGGGGASAGSAGGLTSAGAGEGASSGAMLAAKGGMATSSGFVRSENPKLSNVPEKDRYSDSLYPSHIKEMKLMYHGGSLEKAPMPMKEGGTVPGKAKVVGDSEQNDTVKAKLSPGEVVIPRSIMMSDDPASRAAKFVADLLAKNGKKPEGDFKEALRKAVAGRGKK